MNLFQGSECQKWNKPPIQPGQKKTPWQPNVKPQHVVQRGLGSRMECEATRKRISGIATGYLESQWFPVKEMMYTGFILSIFKWRHETAPAWPQGCDFVWKTMGFLRIFNIGEITRHETRWNNMKSGCILHHGLDSPQPTLTFRVKNQNHRAKWLREPTNSKPERCEGPVWSHLLINGLFWGEIETSEPCHGAIQGLRLTFW